MTEEQHLIVTEKPLAVSFQDILEVSNNFSDIITVAQLKEYWIQELLTVSNDFQEQQKEISKEYLTQLLDTTVRSFFETIVNSVDFGRIEKTFIDFQRSLIKESQYVAQIDFDIPQMDHMDVISTTEYQQLLGRIHTASNIIQVRKEEISHYISLYKKVVLLIENLKRVIAKFLAKDVEMAFNSFDGNSVDYTISIPKKITKELIDDLFFDVDIISTSYKEKIKDLSRKVDEVLSPRHNSLMRKDSAIRLMSKLIEQNNADGFIQGHQHPSHAPNNKQPDLDNTDDAGNPVFHFEQPSTI